MTLIWLIVLSVWVISNTALLAVLYHQVYDTLHNHQIALLALSRRVVGDDNRGTRDTG